MTAAPETLPTVSSTGRTAAPSAPDLVTTASVTAEEAALTGHAYAAARPSADAPALTQEQSVSARVMVGIFVAVPMLAVLAAIPVAWGWGLGWGRECGSDRNPHRSLG